VTLLQTFAGETNIGETGVDASALLETKGTGIVSLAVECLFLEVSVSGNPVLVYTRLP
jgi:hypothetical protein